MSVFGGVTAVGRLIMPFAQYHKSIEGPLREEEYESFMILPRCVFREMMMTMMTMGAM